MTKAPYIARSACRHGITSDDVRLTLDEPEWVTPLPVLVTGEDDQADRSNVNVYGGYDTFGRSLVVFVDRFENIAFHSERGDRRFGWLF